MDYSKIDWSKLPVLPRIPGIAGRFKVAYEEGELRIYSTTASYFTRAPSSATWRVGRTYGIQAEVLKAAIECASIIDRFIAEQEEEQQQKPKPRRVTPKELLVELIQTGDIWHVSPSREERILGFRWNQNCGLQDHRASGEWGVTNIEWFGHFQFFDVLDVGKPRLPVKTKAPEGCEWEEWAEGGVALRHSGGLTIVPRNQESLETVRRILQQYNAVVDAYLELNP